MKCYRDQYQPAQGGSIGGQSQGLVVASKASFMKLHLLNMSVGGASGRLHCELCSENIFLRSRCEPGAVARCEGPTFMAPGSKLPHAARK